MRGEYVESVLSVMASCGMYDYAGDGFIALQPAERRRRRRHRRTARTVGDWVFSPPLDAAANSVRESRFAIPCRESFDLHLFKPSGFNRSVIRLRFNASEVNSSRRRASEEARLLQSSGGAIQLYQIQATWCFHRRGARPECARFIERRAVPGARSKARSGHHESACRMLYHLAAELNSQNRKLVFRHGRHIWRRSGVTSRPAGGAIRFECRFSRTTISRWNGAKTDG